MSLSTYRLLQQRIDAAARGDDPSVTCAAWATLAGYLTAELDRAEQDRATLLDVIRDLRTRIAQLEDAT